MFLCWVINNRYQKKIGTYDKEPWEKTVEQKILDGFSSVTLKTAKLKTELIDVDLVRGKYLKICIFLTYNLFIIANYFFMVKLFKLNANYFNDTYRYI